MPESIYFYNTLSHQVELFKPSRPDEVKLYTCGPTVYSEPHIGNFRYFIFTDTLVRVLTLFGYSVHWVMNITDVGHLTSDQDEGEDKIEVGARREGKTAWEVARYYEEIFVKEAADLNIQLPRLVRATETLPEQIAFIAELEKKGFTYRTNDGIYFDSSQLPHYGQLARLDVKGLQAGKRIGMQDKKHPTDFALWKFSPPGSKRDMQWESPWGMGFPGWHIECSAIIKKELGDQIDIHTGGVDHIPVHHTNELAQSQALTGQPLAAFWLHGEFLQVDDGKMGKSLGNAYTLSELKERGFNPLAFRYLVLSASYRAKLNFTWESLAAAQTSWQRLRGLVDKIKNSPEEPLQLPELHQLQRSLADDLNLPQAVALLWEVLRSETSNSQKLAFVKEVEQVTALGLLEEFTSEPLPVEIQQLVDQREAKRRSKEWHEADELRKKVESLGYLVEDLPEGPHVEKRKGIDKD